MIWSSQQNMVMRWWDVTPEPPLSLYKARLTNSSQRVTFAAFEETRYYIVIVTWKISGFGKLWTTLSLQPASYKTGTRPFIHKTLNSSNQLWSLAEVSTFMRNVAYVHHTAARDETLRGIIYTSELHGLWDKWIHGVLKCYVSSHLLCIHIKYLQFTLQHTYCNKTCYCNPQTIMKKLVY